MKTKKEDVQVLLLSNGFVLKRDNIFEKTANSIIRIYFIDNEIKVEMCNYDCWDRISLEYSLKIKNITDDIITKISNVDLGNLMTQIGI